MEYIIIPLTVYDKCINVISHTTDVLIPVFQVLYFFFIYEWLCSGYIIEKRAFTRNNTCVWLI